MRKRKHLPIWLKDQIWNRDGGECVECGSNEKLEFDHIIPFSKGGKCNYVNLQLLCKPCNRIKHAKVGLENGDITELKDKKIEKLKRYISRKQKDWDIERQKLKEAYDELSDAHFTEMGKVKLSMKEIAKKFVSLKESMSNITRQGRRTDLIGDGKPINTPNEVAKHFGISHSQSKRIFTILRLEPHLLDEIDNGKHSVGSAYKWLRENTKDKEFKRRSRIAASSVNPHQDRYGSKRAPR